MIEFNEKSRFLRSKGARAFLFLKFDGKCFYCGNPLPESWHADHEIPWHICQKTCMNNLKPACPNCNLKKGEKIMTDYMENDYTEDYMEDNYIMENDYTASEYEKMHYIDEDFENHQGLRTCQIGAYNCVVQKLVTEEEKHCSIFLPTGTGKSDLIRMVAEGLVGKRKKFAGVWVFSPNTFLRSQVAKDDVQDFYDRVGVSRSKPYPFLEIDRLDGKRFRNNSILESMTIQYLVTNRNIKLFVMHALKLKKETGLLPIVIFDESHLISTENQWGSAAIILQEIGIPIVLVTGTPWRTDKIRIPGFRQKKIEETTEAFVNNKFVDPGVIKVMKGKKKTCKYRLIPDYAYSYKRAWEDKVLLRPQPIWIDATEVRYDEIVSEMSKSQISRVLRAFLMHDETISCVVKRGIESIRFRKKADPFCCAIVATLSDEADESDSFLSDMHAKKIKREFNRQAPDLNVLIVTSNNNSEDGLKRFKEGNYDVLIIKSMGIIGFNHKPIKTVINLSSYRTLPSFVQLANRGGRIYSKIACYDLILTKDRGMVELWNQFISETNLLVEDVEKIIEEEKIVIIGDKVGPDIEQHPDFKEYETCYNAIEKRNVNDEILDSLRETIPEIANSMNDQQLLNLYSKIKVLGEKSEKDNVIADQQEPLLDMNEEEDRIRAEAHGLVKEITMEIITGLLERKYESKLYGDVQKNLWTCIKRNCGFMPRQTLNNLVGIDNFNSMIKVAKKLKSDILHVPEDRNFNYSYYLRRYVY